jgi:hypothetical protein
VAFTFLPASSGKARKLSEDANVAVVSSTCRPFLALNFPHMVAKVARCAAGGSRDREKKCYAIRDVITHGFENEAGNFPPLRREGTDILVDSWLRPFRVARVLGPAGTVYYGCRCLVAWHSQRRPELTALDQIYGERHERTGPYASVDVIKIVWRCVGEDGSFESPRLYQ